MSKRSQEEPDTLCLIYGDGSWDINSVSPVSKEVAKFIAALKESKHGDARFQARKRMEALEHLRATQPACIRLKQRAKLTGTLETFRSYKSARSEERYIETVFDNIDVTKIRCIRVYTRPSGSERRLYKHCDLNMALTVTIF